MTELHPQADGPAILTPRKDRIEQRLTNLLARHATRSELREVVYQYADLHRLQGIAPEHAQVTLKLIVRRAEPARTIHRDEDPGTTDETMAMLLRWYASRYYRSETTVSLAD
jgi:hypothetical protein